jgi:hypothetical protein
MPEVLGPMTVVQHALPAGVDGVKMAQWRMKDGLTFGQFVALVGTAIGGVNLEFVQKYGMLFSLTEEDIQEYPDGAVEVELPEITDTDDPDMIHGTTIGHHIDLRVYGGAVGGTRRYFRDARRAQIEATIRRLVNRSKWRFEKKLLNRFFVNTEFAVGAAGFNVPFVRGTGGTIDFTPPAYGGKSFDTSHDHFLGVDSDNDNLDDVLNLLAATLVEHGHTAPYEAMVSMADLGAYTALTKFVQMVSPVVTTIDRGGESSGNQMYTRGSPMVVDGVFGHYQSDYGLINLHALNRIPTQYTGMYKSYGQLDPRNPLRVRVHPDEGFGIQVIAVRGDNEKYPIKKLNIEFEFDVGVGEDRTNGAAAYLSSSGNWVNPTIG